MRKGRKPITLSAGILILLFTLMPLGGCQQDNGDFQRQLSAVDSLMQTDADSAFRMLCTMDSLASLMPKALQMEHLLLRCNAQNKADSLFSSDSLGLLLTRYFDRKGTPNQRMLAHYVLGCAYRDMGDSPSALRCFNEAVAAADTSDAGCNIRQLSIIYGQIGGMYNMHCKFNEALNAYCWAEKYATQLGDTFRILNIWANKSDAYIYKGKILEALALKKRTAHELQRLGFRKEAAQTRGLCIRWLSECGQLQKAKACMDDYEQYSGYFMENGDISPGMERYYEIKGLYYQKAGRLDSAEFYYRKLMHTNSAIYEQHAAAWGLSQLYSQLKNTDSVAKYANLCNMLSGDLYLDQSEQAYHFNQSEYDYRRYKTIADKKSHDAGIYWSTLKITLFILGVIVFLFAITFSMYVILRRKNAMLHEASLKERKLHDEKERSNARELEKLHGSINKYREKERLYNNAMREISIYDTTLYADFKMKAKVHAQVTSLSDWKKLASLVENYFPAIRKLYTERKLSWDCYCICLLLKLEFDLSEIKILTGLSSANLSTKRKRMYMKVSGKAGSSEQFDKYIRSIGMGLEMLPEV